MTNHAALIARLCEASEGSAELSAEVWTALTGAPWRVPSMAPHTRRPIVHSAWVDGEGRHWPGNTGTCVTTDLSAAWEEAERRDFDVDVETFRNSDGVSRRYSLKLWCGGNYHDTPTHVSGTCLPCLVCAAILAAEGER